jgi:hypothetical protein
MRVRTLSKKKAGGIGQPADAVRPVVFAQQQGRASFFLKLEDEMIDRPCHPL